MTMLIRSHLAQPVELHLEQRTLVLTPYGLAEVSAQEASGSQVSRMCQEGWLTVTEKTPAYEEPATEPPAKRAGPKRATRA